MIILAYNKIILYGEQTCDYLYIQNDAPDNDEFSKVDSEPSGWSDSTSLFANFNDKNRLLSAGDSDVIGNIVGYKIYRQKYNESHAEYINTVRKSDGEGNDLTIDYSARNKVDYTYYLYPNAEQSASGVALHPLVTKQLAMNCPYWSLLIVDETEDENIFYLDKLFKFELNLEVGDMTNNAQISVTNNFTKHPTVQYGASNYWSGSLSALCGFISCNNIDYVQNENMINELKQLSSDTRRKFLKDIDGNLWEVNVSAPINIITDNTASKAVKSWSFSWVEVNDADNVSIVNNPNKPTKEWVLTDDGILLPHFTYQWGEQYKWDNSYIWTAHEDIYANQDSNLGRDIKG